ncbi:hypothetical protein [Gemmatimonas phototrophica]|nr:hypothetical protein [Gemmatimonas phototrophica]
MTPASFLRATLSLVLLTACGGSTLTDATATPAFARANGGGSGSGGTTTVSVTGASPAIASTDTVVDVTISGSGFAKGASARWSIAGDTTQVQVLSNSYVNSSTLKARIAVPANATIGSYDIVVTNVGGKKGVGAEVFEVVLGDPKTTWYFPLDDSALGLRSDGAFVSGQESVYDNGVCGVSAKLFSSNAFSGSGDATMQTDNPNFRDRQCPLYPRTVSLHYADGHVERTAGFFNLRALENGTLTIPIGSTALRGLTFSLSIRSARCASLRWNDLVEGLSVPGDKLLVTRLDANTWSVESQPAPNNRAYCPANGVSYPLNVRFTVKKRALP